MTGDAAPAAPGYIVAEITVRDAEVYDEYVVRSHGRQELGRTRDQAQAQVMADTE